MNKQHVLVDKYKFEDNRFTYSVEVYETAIGILYRTSDGINPPSYSFQAPELINDKRVEQ